MRSACAAIVGSLLAAACDDAGVVLEEPPAPGCAAGELVTSTGECLAAGVPADACGVGFVADGDGGCVATLPGPCAAGEMALPGESACREVAACGRSRWGEAPVRGSTQFVDAGYAGGGSVGTEAQPWTTIADGIEHAASGAVVAIAAGTYEEDVYVAGKPVILWGRCPRLTVVVALGVQAAGVLVGSGADGSEVRDLSVTGPAIGLGISGSESVIVDRVWVHDTASAGLALQDDLGPAQATIGGTLIEATTYTGLIVGGARADIRDTVVRGTVPRPSDLEGGRGVVLRTDPMTQRRSEVTLRSSLVEHNHDMGIFVGGSDATIESTLVRDTLPLSTDQTFGRNLSIEWDADTGARSVATVRSSVLEGGHGVGLIVVSSDATVESTVVREVSPLASDQTRGVGLAVERHPQSDGADVTVRTSLVDRARLVGLAVLQSTAAVESTIIRDTASQASDGRFGDGIAVAVEAGWPSLLDLRGSRVQTSQRAGVSTFGAPAKLTSTAFECNVIDLDVEPYAGQPASFEDGGGNTCGCDGAAATCQSVSTQLEPPVGAGR
jgi:hypothetical protein